MNNLDYKILFDSSPGLFLILSPDFTIITANKEYCKATLTKCEEITGRHLFEVFPDNPDDPNADGTKNLRASLEYVIKHKKPHTMAVQKYDIRKPDGEFEVRYWNPINSPLLNYENEIKFIVHHVTDVTEFVRAKQENIKKDIINDELSGKIIKMESDIFLRGKEIQSLNENLEKIIEERTSELVRNEKLYRALVENNEGIIAILDKDFKPIYRSLSADKITGWTSEDRKKYGTNDLLHPEDVDKMKKMQEKLLKNPDKKFDMQLRTKHKNGSYVFLEGVMINKLNDPNIKGIITNFRDITERITAEELINVTGKIAKVGGWEINPATMELKCTDEVFRIHELDDNVMPPLKEAINFYAPEVRSIVAEALQKCITEGIPFDIEVPFTTAKGKNIQVRAMGKSEIVNGKVQRAFGVFQDVTELVKSKNEIKKLNEELEQKVIERTAQLNSTMKELEAFSYTVSHDLRAPLRAISGFSKILEEDYGDKLGDDGKRRIDVINTNAKNMGVLIDDLLAFSKLGRQHLVKSNVDMTALTKDCIAEINKSLHHKAKFVLSSLHTGKADVSLMKQVMLNLIANAVKYSSKVESPLIEISSADEKEKTVYRIKDNGAGFDMKYIHKIFGIFERLHTTDEFEGTGVGLAIVERIIKKHGGQIEAYGEVGKGAEFKFSLPK